MDLDVVVVNSGLCVAVYPSHGTALTALDGLNH